MINDTSHGGIDKLFISDALNQTTAACRERARHEFHSLFNPFYWIKELLVFVLRIPFGLLGAAGFNIKVIEENLFGRLFKVLELVALIYLLTRMGWATDQVRQLLAPLLAK